MSNEDSSALEKPCNILRSAIKKLLAWSDRLIVEFLFYIQHIFFSRDLRFPRHPRGNSGTAINTVKSVVLIRRILWPPPPSDPPK